MEVRVFVQETQSRRAVGVPVEGDDGEAPEYVDTVEVKNGLPASMSVGCDPRGVAGQAVACTAKIFDEWGNPAGAIDRPAAQLVLLAVPAAAEGESPTPLKATLQPRDESGGMENLF